MYLDIQQVFKPELLKNEYLYSILKSTAMPKYR